MKDRKLVGIYLKERRLSLGLSQLQIAKLLGFDSPMLISQWERGIAFPPKESFSKIPEVYKISKDEWASILEAESMGER